MIKIENDELRVAGEGSELLEDYKKMTIGLLEIIPFRHLAKAFRDGISAFADQTYDKEEQHGKLSDKELSYIRQVRKINLVDTKKFTKKKDGGKK